MRLDSFHRSPWSDQELPDSHRSYNSLQSMSTTPENKAAIDLAEEFKKSNVFFDNLLDVLLTLQFEVIENRQLQSNNFEKALGKSLSAGKANAISRLQDGRVDVLCRHFPIFFFLK